MQNPRAFYYLQGSFPFEIRWLSRAEISPCMVTEYPTGLNDNITGPLKARQTMVE
jgi:hypothetical protein